MEIMNNLIEGIKDISIVIGPFVGIGIIGVAIQNHKEHKAMKMRHKKRFEEIKENNRRRGICNEREI